MSKRMDEANKLVEAGKLYDAKEAIDLALKMPKAKFDETVEMHIKLGVDSKQADQQVRGVIVLPNGTGKSKKVLVIAKGDKAEAAVHKAVARTVCHRAVRLRIIHPRRKVFHRFAVGIVESVGRGNDYFAAARDDKVGKVAFRHGNYLYVKHLAFQFAQSAVYRHVVQRRHVAEAYHPAAVVVHQFGYVAAVIGFAQAIEIACAQINSYRKHISALRNQLKAKLATCPQIRFLGSEKLQLANFLPITVAGLDAERLIFKLEQHSLYLSTGAACAASKGQKSAALAAIGLSDAEIAGSLRISLGRLNKPEDIDRAGELILSAIQEECQRLSRQKGAKSDTE